MLFRKNGIVNLTNGGGRRMPNVSKKRVIGLMAVLQSVLCLACLSAWFVGCILTMLWVSEPGLYREDEAMFLMMLTMVACVFVTVLIYRWNKRVNMILWTWLVMGPGALSLANLVSKPRSDGGLAGECGILTFLDLSKWRRLSLFLLFLIGCVLFTPLIGMIATVFFYSVVLFVVAYMVMIATRYVRFPYGAG